MSLLNSTAMASRPACQRSHRIYQRTSYLYSKVRCKRQCRSGRSCQRANAAENPDMDAAMQQAMQDPKMREQVAAYEQAMKDPSVQAQAQQMAQVMQSKEMMEKMARLQQDPELQPMFDEIKKGGMAAMMKFMNDPAWLSKVGEKLGDVQVPAGDAAVAPPAGPNTSSAPEINNIMDAAKHGDMEAVEDFIAVGKDVNQRDAENRTALHYAVAYKHKDIFDELLASGADLSAQDSQGNNPLHYAAGYGRSEFVKDLIDAGAQGFSKNSSGHTPFDLVRMEKRNPLNEDRELMKLLEVASSN